MPQQFDQRLGQLGRRVQPLGKSGQFLARRQRAVQQQKGDFLERRVPGQLVHRITAVFQPPGDRADGRFAGHDTLQARAVDRFGHGFGSSVAAA